MKNTACCIDLSELPRIKEGGTRINWQNSVGCKVSFVYNDISDVFYIIEYIGGSYVKVKVQYKDRIMDIPTSMVAKGHIGRLIGVRTNEFKIPLNIRLFDEHRDIIITDRKYIKDKKGREYKYYKYTCEKCGFDCGKHYSIKEKIYKNELWVLESHLLKHNVGCACCGHNSVVIVEGINDIPTTTPWMIPYFQGGYEEAKQYTYGSTKKIYPKCPNCGLIFNKKCSIMSIYNKEISCICSDGISYPNKFMYKLLKQLDVLFEREFRPDWCSNYFYDFYIPSLNLIIEMDGGIGHANGIMFSNSKNTLEERIETDKYKVQKAKEHGIDVIRIDCQYNHDRFNYIKENTITKLNDVFDLSVVDWNECDKFAMSSLAKQACELKNNNPNLRISEIADLLDLSPATILRYLKEGNKLNLCKYNKEEQRLINERYRAEKIKEAKSKPVEVFKDGVSCGIFQSASYLERESMEIFGVKFYSSNISKICKGILKTSKGYTFKYIENET